MLDNATYPVVPHTLAVPLSLTLYPNLMHLAKAITKQSLPILIMTPLCWMLGVLAILQPEQHTHINRLIENLQPFLLDIFSNIPKIASLEEVYLTRNVLQMMSGMGACRYWSLP